MDHAALHAGLKGDFMRLTLAEELLLLALDDRDGHVVFAASTALDFGLRGAVLAELATTGQLALDNKKVTAVPSPSTGDDLLDNALAAIGAAKRPRGAGHWVDSLRLGRRSLRDQLLDRLVQHGILRRVQRRFLWVFPFQRYPTQDARPEAQVRTRLRAAIMGGATPQPRMLALIGLVSECSLVNEVFPAQERKYARRRIQELLTTEATPPTIAVILKAVKDAIASYQAAAVAGAIAATTASTATH